jgi:nicotinamidase/pyrazinamidase
LKLNAEQKLTLRNCALALMLCAAAFVGAQLLFKGEDPAREQYSGFEGRNEAGQSLSEVLHLLEADEVHVAGIATEYCIRNTAEDLLKDGFRVNVLTDCLAWVDRRGHEEALLAMKEEGIRML